jgi:hypothetical protein
VPALSLRLYDGRRLDPPVRDYQVAAIDGILDVGAGAAADPVASVTAESMAWSAVLFEGVPLTGAERDGSVRVAGDRDAILLIVRLYAAPVGTISTLRSPG